MGRRFEYIKWGILSVFLSMVFFRGRVEASIKIDQDTVNRQMADVNLKHQLDSLRNRDDLEDWLNVWYVYLSDEPASHYEELAIPLQTIWRKPETSSEQIAWFYMLILVGYYELQQGNILSSTNVYEQAYRFVKDADAIQNSEILEYLIKPLGNNYTRLGDYERAFYIQKEGLKLADSLDNPMQEAAMLANLSTTSRWNAHLSKALEYTTEGLKKVESGTALQGLLYSTRADILQSKDALKKADVAIQKALSLFSDMEIEKESNAAYWYAGTLVTAGEIEQKRGHLNQAEKNFNQALHLYRIYFQQSRQREKLKVLVALGQVNVSKKKFKKGLAYYNEALEGLLPGHKNQTRWPADSVLYAENTLMDALKGKAEVLQSVGQKKKALVGYQKVALVLQRLRKTIFSEEAKRLLQQQSQKTTEDAIDLSYQLYRKTKKSHFAEIALQMAEQHKARLLLDVLQKNISYSKINQKDSVFIQQKQLKQAIAFYTHSYIEAVLQNNTEDSLQWKNQIEATEYQLSLIHNQLQEKYPTLLLEDKIEFQELLSSLPEKTIAWEYFTGPQEWYGFAVQKGKVIDFKWLGSADELEQISGRFIEKWFAAGPTAMINHPQQYVEASFRLYNKLKLRFSPTNNTLYIIPDGVLGKLPFEALVTDKEYHSNPGKWAFLLHKATISQSYSLAVWGRLQKSFSEKGYEKGFSGFFIDPDGASGLATLAGVEAEEQQIKEQISGDFYKNGSATANQLLEALQNDEVVHLSTHSFLMGEAQIPALQMADKRLVLADLYPVQAHPALVMMSACQTADGLLSPGEGIISLAREFTSVGAGGVVAALWSINDETAAQLTAAFYKNLQQSGDKAAALYQTKQNWLADGQKSNALKLPYYWAGLVYYGNNVPLSKTLKIPFSMPLWAWVGLGLLLIIALSLIQRKKNIIRFRKEK